MKNDSSPAPFPPLVLVAGLCACASVAIVALGFCLNGPLSATAIWAVAAMAASPAAMGVGIAYFLTRRVPLDART